MAENLFDVFSRYGIKETANVTLYHLDNSGAPDYPVLYCDSAKTFTLNFTADENEARGGYGNALLLSWDSNKDITVDFEDALFSPKSLAIMFGNGTVGEIPADTSVESKRLVMRSEYFTPTTDDFTVGTDEASDGKGWTKNFVARDGKAYPKVNARFFDSAGTEITAEVSEGKLTKGTTYLVTYDLEVAKSGLIEISADSFPSAYYVTADTYIRSQESGKDYPMQIIIPKAKVTSENTITLEADGDPSVNNFRFELNADVKVA